MGYGKKTWFKFIFFSLFGIFMFFVSIRINGSSGIPVDHIIGLLKSLLKHGYRYILLAAAGYAAIRKAVKKEVTKSASGIFFFVATVCGFLLCLISVIAPNSPLTPTVMSSVDATGNILCAIFVSAVFVPFLIDYGLVDAVGALCRRFMRRLFLTPGSSAVIGVSAFLGNYSMGHIIAEKMYLVGEYTHKEATIVALGFSTCSVGLMINLVNYLELKEYWHLYVLCVALVTFVTTMTVSRIFPISRKSDAYIGGAAQARQFSSDGNPAGGALKAGLDRAARANGLGRSMLDMIRRIFPIICEVAGVSVAVITCGLFLAEHTPVFNYPAILIRPILRLFGIGGRGQIVRAVSVGLLEPVLAGVISEGLELSLMAKWVIAVVPYSAIIFFAGFIPSVMSVKLDCKLWELLVLWLERVLISTVLTCLFALVAFRLL